MNRVNQGKLRDASRCEPKNEADLRNLLNEIDF